MPVTVGRSTGLVSAVLAGRRRRSAWQRVPVAAVVVIAVFVSIGACSAAESNGAAEGGGEASTWIHGIVPPKGDSGFILMAKERQYYKRQGVDATVKPFGSNLSLVQALISGAINSAETAPAAVFDAVARGAELKIIGSTLPGMTYNLYAKDDVKTFQDLDGKTLGIAAPGSFSEALPKAMMSTRGIDPGSVRLVNAGNDAQRVKALLAGRVDVAAASPEFVPAAKEPGSGIHVLGKAEQIVPKYPRFMIVANEKSLQEKPRAAVRFLAAEMQGIRYAAEHRKAALAVAGRTLGESPDSPRLVAFYEAIKDADAASPTAEIPMEKLIWLQQLRLKLGFQQRKLDLKEVVDGSFRQQALKRVS